MFYCSLESAIKILFLYIILIFISYSCIINRALKKYKIQSVRRNYSKVFMKEANQNKYINN